MEFGYNSVTDYGAFVDIENIYDVGIEAIDSDGNYYLVIKTALGESSCVEFGPISLDEDILLDSYKMEFVRMKSKDKDISSKIFKFLGPKKRTKTAIKNSPNKFPYAKIVVVNLMTPNEALDHAINACEYLKHFSNTENF